MIWREWEVELVEGDAALLATAAAMIEDSGGKPSEATKLAKALGDRVPLAPEQVMPTPTRKAPPPRWCRPGWSNRSQ